QRAPPAGATAGAGARGGLARRSSRRKGEGVRGGGLGGGGAEGHRIGAAVQPVLELVHEPRTDGVAGLPEDDVEGGGVRVAEVGGEALGRTEGVSNLLYRSQVAALRLRAGAGGYGDRSEERRVGKECRSRWS